MFAPLLYSMVNQLRDLLLRHSTQPDTSVKSRLASLSYRNSVSRSLPYRKRCQPRSPSATALQDAGALTSMPRTSARSWTAVG